MSSKANNFHKWFYERIGDSNQQGQQHHNTHQQDHWLNVMCLTGVDYFSSLGFAPAMAFLYTGLLSPFATFFLVLLNLFGAYPMYAKVAELSPHGQGSISMLQDLLPSWWGKLLVLCLLGFAGTDFMMTITLCSSDAAKHLVENPLAPIWLKHQLGLSLFLVTLLGAVFLKGFRDAIWLAVILVWSYLALSLVVLGVCFKIIWANPSLVYNWQTALFAAYPSYWQIVGLSLLAFPKLALGMSGFETGVAVMPHVRGFATDDETHPLGRIKHAKYLLLTSAVIMSFFLAASAFVTTILIPAAEFGPAGKANGRALAYLAHQLLGSNFGTVYDISTIFILWFAGASAMAGLLNLIPRYLPRYGMAPSWVASLRPLVLLLTTMAIILVLYFKADVDAQAGAFATGLLVLMTSAALASTLAVWNARGYQRYLFLTITLVFSYTTINNIIARPDGLHVASVFILFIILSSFLSRCLRSTELRVGEVKLDAKAEEFLRQACHQDWGEIRLLAHRPNDHDYQGKEHEARKAHSIQNREGDFIFVEVSPTDPSSFVDDSLEITGVEHRGYKIWRCNSASVPNAFAAILLKLRDETGKIPNAYFGWTEGHPIGYVFKYILLGEGETAPLTREILRKAEPDSTKRPRVHVS
jgi:hypothetical protein